MGRNIIKQAGKEKAASFKGCSVLNLKQENEDYAIQKWPIWSDNYILAGTYIDITRGDKNLKDIE